MDPPEVSAALAAIQDAQDRYLSRWREIARQGRGPTPEEHAHLLALQERRKEAEREWREQRRAAGLPEARVEISVEGRVQGIEG